MRSRRMSGGGQLVKASCGRRLHRFLWSCVSPDSSPNNEVPRDTTRLWAGPLGWKPPAPTWLRRSTLRSCRISLEIIDGHPRRNYGGSCRRRLLLDLFSSAPEIRTSAPCFSPSRGGPGGSGCLPTTSYSTPGSSTSQSPLFDGWVPDRPHLLPLFSLPLSSLSSPFLFSLLRSPLSPPPQMSRILSVQ